MYIYICICKHALPQGFHLGSNKKEASKLSIHLRLRLFYMLFSSPFHPLILSEPKSHPNLFSQTLTSGSPNSYPKNYPPVAYPTKHPHIPDILSVLSVLPWRSCPSKWARRRWKPHGAPEFGTIQSKKNVEKRNGQWQRDSTMVDIFDFWATFCHSWLHWNIWDIWDVDVQFTIVHLFNSCRLWMFSPHHQNIWSG